jgi:hypothetical protein
LESIFIRSWRQWERLENWGFPNIYWRSNLVPTSYD